MFYSLSIINKLIIEIKNGLAKNYNLFSDLCSTMNCNCKIDIEYCSA